ncbi:hypothetical protein LTR37_019774 [Vermiconidia calcicola]|uniref:Uncharacterized protein n=1 Tax=Vermiconidia calcicola TaxID=1690605 RepID=A0ACC3MG97_9PEZI|nr:hypothetical protein LTR37_019774 [Vermiconidia calcicola]
MAPPASQPYNYSIHAIPAAFMFGIVPHGYYLVRLMVATNNQISTAMPRTNLDTWKGKLSSGLWNHLARARGAHLNSLEVFPLFAASMIAGNVAQLPAKDMNSMAFSFFAARALYMAAYITITNNTLAYARTGVYAWSISIPILGLWKSGQSLAQNQLPVRG